MRSPVAALLWDIWNRHRQLVWAIAALTAIGWAVDIADRAGQPDGASSESNPVVTMLGLLAFLMLFAVFNYTESDGDGALGRFPQRLFTLPMSSLRLVAVPVLAGVAAVALLLGAWLPPLTRGGSASPAFVALLVAAFMVFYQSVLWTLPRLGPLRLLLLGAIAIALFAIGILPAFPPGPPPAWRSEVVLSGGIALLAGFAFVATWRHVASVRSGGDREARRLSRLLWAVADALPSRQRAFATPTGAQVWFEWRSSGMTLPILAGGIVVFVIAPLSWIARHDAGDTLRLLLATLATPIVLAVPVGLAFAKPSLWSDDLSLPGFVAVRPLSAGEIVAVKVETAMLAAGASWIVILLFLAVWLSSWANLDAVRAVTNQLWTLHGRSSLAMFGIALLLLLSGLFLTWRFLVSRLWVGLSGHRRLFMVSAVSLALIAFGAAVIEAGELSRWLIEDSDRAASVVWIVALAVLAKFVLAGYGWRQAALPLRRRYMLVWLVGVGCFVALAGLVWRLVKMSVPAASDDIQMLLMLAPLLVVPLGRPGIAPLLLARNRHR